MFKNKERSILLGAFFYLKVVINKGIFFCAPLSKTYCKFVKMEKQYSKLNPQNIIILRTQINYKIKKQALEILNKLKEFHINTNFIKRK